MPHEFGPSYKQSVVDGYRRHGFQPDSGVTIASSACHSASECQRASAS